MPPSLLAKTTCPNCWYQFEPHEVLWVSAHPSLRGDVRLVGGDAHRRFLPSRFSPEGDALDAMGAACTQLACPRCHLAVPRACLEVKPWFVSLFGAPSSGKTYLLAAMMWALRRRLPELFRVGFTDADASTNQALAGWEEQLFFNPTPDAALPLGDLIKKTLETGDQYNTVAFGNEQIRYPQPFLFTLRPRPDHPLADDDDAARVLCFYDNAGESFLAGGDKANSPVTRHLAESALLMFLFDPLQHAPFRQRLAATGVKLASDARPGTGVNRQDLIVTEAAGRVRRFARLRDNEKHDRPLVVIVTKMDVWGSLVPELSTPEQPIAATKSRAAALNLDRINEQSQAIRRLLVSLTPEVVTAAEEFATSVTYVGVSALGVAPTENVSLKRWTVRPTDLRPTGVEIPLLLGLHKHFPQLISGGRRPPPAGNGKRP